MSMLSHHTRFYGCLKESIKSTIIGKTKSLRGLKVDIKHGSSRVIDMGSVLFNTEFTDGDDTRPLIEACLEIVVKDRETITPYDKVKFLSKLMKDSGKPLDIYDDPNEESKLLDSIEFVRIVLNLKSNEYVCGWLHSGHALIVTSLKFLPIPSVDLDLYKIASESSDRIKRMTSKELWKEINAISEGQINKKT